MPDNFDYAILGGGAAGFSLALALIRSPLRDKSILIVEKDDKSVNDRTWCFWTDAPSPFEGIACRSWPRLSFLSDTLERTWDLSPFRYVMLRGLDFYDHARDELQKYNVTFLRGTAEVTDGEEYAEITVTETPDHLTQEHVTRFHASYAFDSRLRPEDIIPDQKYNYLKQHFLGWEVETERPVFDPEAVTLFDLRTPQRGGLTFIYTLPFSPTNALVEYTLFSRDLLPLGEYETALRAHLDEVKAGEYHILSTERGVIPMTDHPFPRRLGKHVLAIGARGGRIKPSTGYAFNRIQRDSERIAASLARHGHPFAIPPDNLHFCLHDALMLDIFANEPEFGRPILSAIFEKNPIQRVLKFLDDRTSAWEDLPIMAAHAPGPFLRAFRRRVVR